jgi:hypothetical protein
VANKTWDAFKPEFALAHQELCESQLTTGSTGFHFANAAIVHQHKTADAMANFATATAANRQTVAALTATISQLTLKLSAANTKLLLAKATQQSCLNALALTTTPPSTILPTAVADSGCTSQGCS